MLMQCAGDWVLRGVGRVHTVLVETGVLGEKGVSISNAAVHRVAPWAGVRCADTPACFETGIIHA